ncbi:MAG: DUF1579 domain-containing protein [Pirellulales bacterium]
MKSFAVLGCLVLMLTVVTSVRAQEVPQPSKPTEQHKWLQQLVGEWETRGEMSAGPEKDPIVCEGTENIRSIGGLWTISENKSNYMGVEVTGVMTLGYDAKAEKFVGTWVDSMFNHLWKYEGTLSDDGKKLTLMTEGPSPTEPDQMFKYRESIEIKSPDQKVFTSAIQVEDGQWVTFATITAQRKK